MHRLFQNRSGRRIVRPASLLLALSVLLSGCLYSFSGGGLPRHIRTVAVLPFENETLIGPLSTEIQQALQTEMQRRLGVRLAREDVADAVVRGRITNYEETTPGVRPAPNPNAPGVGSQPIVAGRQIQLTITAEIYDLREEKMIWQGSGIQGIGPYQPARELATDGIAKAISDLVKKITEGAQSQW
jgi:hypothetical protein